MKFKTCPPNLISSPTKAKLIERPKIPTSFEIAKYGGQWPKGQGAQRRPFDELWTRCLSKERWQLMCKLLTRSLALHHLRCTNGGALWVLSISKVISTNLPPPKETGHRRIWRKLLSVLQNHEKINQTTHVQIPIFPPMLNENCKQDTEVWNVTGSRTVQRVVESGCAIGPKVCENLVILLRDPNPWSVRARTKENHGKSVDTHLALRNLRNSWS